MSLMVYCQISSTAGGDTLDFSATELVDIAAIDAGAGNDSVTGGAGGDLVQERMKLWTELLPR